MAADLDDEARVAYLAELHDVADNPIMFIFIDESAKDRLVGRRRRGWARRGYHKRHGHFEHHERGRYTFIAAADVNGFVIGACTTVMRSSSGPEADEDIGTINRERFEQYVEYELLPHLGRYALGEPHSVVVLDNCTTHTGPRTRELIEGAGAILIYTSALSPDLNPIEPMFHVYKADLKRYRIADMNQAHFHAMLSVTPAKARRFFAELRGAIRNVVLLDEHKDGNREIEMVATASAMAAAVAAAAFITSHKV
jgi:transposase